jgi:hypothetical protein
VDLCLVVMGGVLFNLFPDRIGYYVSLAEPWRFTPLLAPEFSAHLPALNLYLTLACSLCAVNLTLLRWNIYTRSADAALKILGVIIMLQMVAGGPLALYAWLDQFAKLGLAVAIIPASIAAIGAVGRLLTGVPRQSLVSERDSIHA